MPQTPGDDKKEPSLELPTLKLPGLGRSRRTAPDGAPAQEAPAEETAPKAEAPTAEAPQAASPRAVDAPPRRRAATRAIPTRASRNRKAPSGITLPALPGPTAAALTGLGVGLVGAAATYSALTGCEAVRGVSTCGGAPGFFILVAIVVLMVLLGGTLLKMLGVRDSTSTSFLAVGLVAVIVMLTLLDVIMSPWMFLVVPALGALAYLLAHWVTTRFDEEATGRRDWM